MQVKPWRKTSRVDEVDLRPFSVGDWTFDTKNQALSCSDEIYDLLGFIKGRSDYPYNVFLHAVLPEDKILLKKCWEHILRGEMVGSITYRILSEGHIRVVYCPIKNKYDADGRLIAVSGTIRDITNLENTILDMDVSSNSDGIHTKTALICIDKYLKVVSVNPRAEDLFGWTEQELLLKELPHVPSGYQDSQKDIYQTILEHGGTVRFDTVRITKDGTINHIGVIQAPVRSHTGDIVGVQASYTEPIERGDEQRIFSEIEQQIMAMFQNSADVCMILSKELKMTYVSPAIKNVLGYPPSQFLQFDPKFIIHPDDLDIYKDSFRDLLSNPMKTQVAELRLKSSEGDWRYCSTRARYLNKHYGIDGIIVNFHDVTENRKNQELMQYMSFYDMLTELPNRRLFEERLSVMLGNRNKTLGLLRLNVNRIEYINDTLGRSMGDELIKFVAGELRKYLGPGRTVARIGENEFAVIVPDLRHKNDMLDIAHSLREMFQDPILINQRALYPSCNIGIAVFPEDGTETNELIKNTDVALRHSFEELGPNTIYLYSANLNTQNYKAFSLANDFRSALENLEFTVHYQPRVETSTGNIIGAEALIRWEHPQWGMVGPQEFLHIAEEASLIVPLGEWILREVCHQIRKWTEEGFGHLCVSVNFAVNQLLDPNIVDMVRHTLEESHIRPDQLEIEITETSILPNDPKIISAIGRLRDMGIRVFFDDFGTGYSALSSLYQFDLDGLKLDRAFICNLPDAAVPAEIVSSVIKMAHGLDLTVVAEGVENESQLDFLENLGCDQIQGFLYSKPVKAYEFSKLLQIGVETEDKKAVPLANVQNRRKYSRVYIETPLIATFTLTRLKQRSVKVGYSKILIVDISPGGLRFVSDLQLSAEQDVVYKFQTQVLDEPIELTGQIVWRESYEETFFQYGVQIIAEKALREKLVQLFNNVENRLQNQTVSYGEEFYAGDLNRFFR